MESQLCLSIKRVPGADVGAFPLQLSFKISWKVYNYAANSNSEQIFEDSWVGLVGLGCSQYRLVVSLTFATFPIAEGLLYQRVFPFLLLWFEVLLLWVCPQQVFPDLF